MVMVGEEGDLLFNLARIVLFLFGFFAALACVCVGLSRLFLFGGGYAFTLMDLRVWIGGAGHHLGFSFFISRWN